MDLISPHSHTYLHHPLFSSGEAMLNYALGHMVHTGALAVRHAPVVKGHDTRHVFSRLFLSRAVEPGSLPAPEARLLELFTAGRSFSLGGLRKLIDEAFPLKGIFKKEFMQPYLLEQGLLASPYHDTPEGRTAYHRVIHLVHRFEHEAGELAEQPAAQQERLAELGSNVMLLHWRVIDALRASDDVPDLVKAVLYVQRYLESGGFYFSEIRN